MGSASLIISERKADVTAAGSLTIIISATTCGHVCVFVHKPPNTEHRTNFLE